MRTEGCGPLRVCLLKGKATNREFGSGGFGSGGAGADGD